MDSDVSQLYKHLPGKIYPVYPKKIIYYQESYQKFNRNPTKKSPYYSKQSSNYTKPSYRTPTKDANMNQLTPRCHQRAIYSQQYRTDYDTSWRANLLAATCRSKYYSKNYESKINKNVFNLGVRPEPEGAVSNNAEENDNLSTYTDYDKVLNEDIVLYSDYGSDSDDLSGAEEQKFFQESDDKIPDSTWTTATLIAHAFNKASSNKVTVMSYAVIGAELHSIAKLHNSKIETDLVKFTKRTQKLTESIDKARMNLKEIALGLRACKQEMKSKSSKTSNANERSQKHSVPSNESNPENAVNLQDLDRRLNKRKSIAVIEQTPIDNFDDPNLPNYCTVDRRHRYHKERRSKRLTVPILSMLNYMNLDVADKVSSLD